MEPIRKHIKAVYVVGCLVCFAFQLEADERAHGRIAQGRKSQVRESNTPRYQGYGGGVRESQERQFSPRVSQPRVNHYRETSDTLRRGRVEQGRVSQGRRRNPLPDRLRKARQPTFQINNQESEQEAKRKYNVGTWGYDR